ncbi:MAG: MFS transporter [Aestuariivirga sp.]
MTIDSPSSPTRARWAVFMIFLQAGLIIGAWVPHVPLAKDRLAVGPAMFGLGLLAIAVGAVISMPFAGALINRFGSARVTLFAGLLFAVGFLGPVTAPTLILFMMGALVMGLGMGSMDVAMNAHGLAVEKALGKPIISSLHAAFSVGAMLGAFSGAWLLDVAGPLWQALIFSATFIVLHIFMCSNLLPAKVDRGLSESHFGWPTKATIGLGALCFLALMIEGSISDWAAILMRQKFAIDAGYAAFGFAFYQTGMAATRFLGDVSRKRFGAVNLVVASAVLTALGTGAALLAPSPWLSFLAFALGGCGIGNVAPVLFAGGGRLEPAAPGRGIAAVVSMGYAGFLAGPPLIGFVAQVSTLQIAMGLTVVAAMLIAVFARGVAPADTY